ncbi:polysaccharide deacetylase family protein [Fulvimarina endophytica]|uniref:Chitooligosaccharide deacetylase n=1 Tax=Fulvimarina endophytica TaxID=2293836 RepID=A0A371X3B3_9HYPH|nr:polysaccharide deacetylase family protein [Fulvimarina endophytica]RFC63689.1 polysaccharide deacetylase family protein [Fulvimarina endophytica]
MRLFRSVCLLLCVAALPACATRAPGLSGAAVPVADAPRSEAETLAFAASSDDERSLFPLSHSFLPARRSSLAGRTLSVASIEDIDLADGEVVITFDDGPMPEKTPKILDALAEAGVGATFLMVGQMASAHPEIARQVAAGGHTVGTHTERHPNLRTMSFEAALAEIRRGEASVAKALGEPPAPFFRFPYLADTKALRARLATEAMVPLDVDIDSKDYFRDAPDTVMARTLGVLQAKRKGIILFHDIQARTAALLPDFLKELDRLGFKVVDLKPADEVRLASR